MRELREETGLSARDVFPNVVSFDLHFPCPSVVTKFDGEVWRSIYFRCDLSTSVDSAVRIMEPAKHSEFSWFTKSGLELAHNAGELFPPLGQHLEALGLIQTPHS